MPLDLKIRRELAQKGGKSLIDLNRSLRGAGQAIISMNTDQLIEFQLWLEKHTGGGDP